MKGGLRDEGLLFYANHDFLSNDIAVYLLITQSAKSTDVIMSVTHKCLSLFSC